MEAVKCPKCGKTLIFHIEGSGASYELKCYNDKCRAIIKIYSAGRTAVQKDLTFKQLENIVKNNKGIDITKII